MNVIHFWSERKKCGCEISFEDILQLHKIFFPFGFQSMDSELIHLNSLDTKMIFKFQVT